MQWGARRRCAFTCAEHDRRPAPHLSHTYLVRWGTLHLLPLTWSEALCLAPAEAQAWPSVVAAVVATWGWGGMGCALCLGYSRWAARVGTKQNTHKRKKTQTEPLAASENKRFLRHLSRKLLSILATWILPYEHMDEELWVVLKAFPKSTVLGTHAQCTLSLPLELLWPSLHSRKWPANFCLVCFDSVLTVTFVIILMIIEYWFNI